MRSELWAGLVMACCAVPCVWCGEMVAVLSGGAAFCPLNLVPRCCCCCCFELTIRARCSALRLLGGVARYCCPW